MASAMIAQSITSPVFAPSMTHPSLFSKPALTMKMQLPDTGNMSLLRGKRPASLALPIMTSFEHGSSDVAKLEDDVTEAEGEGYAVYSKKGKKRGPSEDRYSAVNYRDGKNSKKLQALFGVFDGHGGEKAAEFAAKSLGKNIMGRVSRINNGEMEVEKAVREGYLMTDSGFTGGEDARGGACCATALIRDGDLVVSNVGDCRAVMSRSGAAEALTSDHKPSVESERLRMQHLGGFVDCYRGVWRVQGTLAVSRSIGDKTLKTWVIAEPETKTLRMTPDCEFLILASDGLWDKVGNQEAVDLVRTLHVGEEKPNLTLAAKRLAELAIRRGSLDDTTVMIVRLDQFMC